MIIACLPLVKPRISSVSSFEWHHYLITWALLSPQVNNYTAWWKWCCQKSSQDVFLRLEVTLGAMTWTCLTFYDSSLILLLEFGNRHRARSAAELSFVNNILISLRQPLSTSNFVQLLHKNQYSWNIGLQYLRLLHTAIMICHDQLCY